MKTQTKIIFKYIVAAISCFTLISLIGCGGSGSSEKNKNKSPEKEIKLSLEFIPLPENGAAHLFEPAISEPGTFYSATKESVIGDNYTGLWKTSNYGDSWEQLTTDSIEFIRVSPKNPDFILVALEDSYKISIDGGLTWNSGSIPYNDYGWTLEFSDGALNSINEPIYLSSDSSLGHGGIYKTEDLGNTWEHLLSKMNYGNSVPVYSFKTHENDPSTIFSLSFNDSLFIKSIDGGLSNYSLKNGISTSLGFYNEGVSLDRDNPELVIIENHISVNGGANWNYNDALTPERTFWLDGNLLHINDGYNSELLVSKDYGATWNKLMPIRDREGRYISWVRQVIVTNDAIYFEDHTSPNETDHIYRVPIDGLRDRISRL